MNALRHPANRPGALVRRLAGIVNPAADLRGLEDGGGVVCDFRPGLEEKDPSLSVSMGRDGAVFKRFGGDGFEGGALAFTASALGISEGEAARLLIEWAGIPDTPPEDRKGRGRATLDRKRGKSPSPAKEEGKKARQGGSPGTVAPRRVSPDTVREKLALQGPLTPDALAHALRGWVPIEAGEDSPEHAELARRGLSPALESGILRAYRFAGKVGREGGPWKTYRLPRFVLPGAVAFEVRGPDGKAWAVKVRNPGSKADLEAAKANRYAYLTKGGHSPAWCAPGFEGDAARPMLAIEGELNAVAVQVMLEAAGQGHAYRVQGVASASAWPHLHGLEAGRVAYLYADPDAEGDAARGAWAALCASAGATVRQVGRGGGAGAHVIPFAFPSPSGSGDVTGGDACDALGRVPDFGTAEDVAAWQGARLLEALEEAGTWQPPAKEEATPEEGQGEAGDVWLSDVSGYGVRGGKLCALKIQSADGREWESAETLAEFTAYITAEVFEEDGAGEAARLFELEGTRPDGGRLPRVRVTAAEFEGMRWPVAKWGAGGIVHAGQGKKDKARAAIQLLSAARGVAERTVYRHTGWIQYPQHGPLYLTAGAVIGRAGAVSGVEVDLGGRLNAYALPDPGEGSDLRAAVRHSLALLNLAPDPVAVPILGAVYRAPLGRSDFAVWPTGETGRHKTAFAAFAMAHFGAGWHRRHLPDGWNSSPNALESAAFRVKDALFLIDDFKPSGQAGEAARMHAAAARILHGVADGQGRGTLTADRRERAALYPRGTVMSSSERLPQGYSNRARLLAVPVTARLIHSPALKAAFDAAEDLGAAGVYAHALAGYVRHIAGHFGELMAEAPGHRDAVRQMTGHFAGLHGRTGPAVAELAYGWGVFLAFALEVGAVTPGEGEALWGRVLAALGDVARGQGEHLRSEDPVERALSILAGLLGSGRVFLEDRREGGPPQVTPERYGWEYHPRRDRDGEEVGEWRTRPGATRVGWHEKDGGDEWGYFQPDALHEALQRAATGQGAGQLPDAGTLWANMRDRLQPLGAMRCEAVKKGGQVTGWRPMWKATVYGMGGQPRLLTLRLPIDPDIFHGGISGINGINGEESTTETAFSSIPLTLFFKKESGINGIKEAPFSSPPAPRALTLEDLEDLPEGADLPGTVTL